MSHFAVAAVGADRPGIVAAVTGVFVEHGCNLEDSSMTILRGYFAMMLVVDAPAGLGPEQLQAALAVPAAAYDLVVTVRPIEDAVPPPPAGDTWTLAVYGTDRPGIVHRVATLLAGESVNIVDVSSRVIGDPNHPAYAMVLEVTLPPGADADDLGRKLQHLADDLGVSCSFHPSEADIL
jgi:glycine cleavage system transcriptional repressor